MSRPLITVENLSKSFNLKHKQPDGGYANFRDVLLDISKKVFHPKKYDPASTELFWALKDVSFEVQQGDRLGIIGHNGSGKSTLLKILSRIVAPTRGRITIEGRVASLLEVGTGFHPELSGRENIYLNGAILGMSKAETKSKFDEIVDFSGVEKFLDTPVKRYSSGMYVRLAFAVAAHLEPEILIVDEVLAVGDAEFQKKCLGKMESVSKEQGRTVLFVSHQMGTIAQLCNRSMLLNSGNIEMIGNTNNVIDAYLNKVQSENTYAADLAKVKQNDAYISSQRLINRNGENVSQITNNDELILEIGIVVNKWNPVMELSVSLQNNLKGRIFTVNKKLPELMIPSEKHKTFRFVVPANTITPNQYSWLNAIHIPGQELIDVLWDECHFSITDAGTEFARYEGSDYGVIFLNTFRFEL